MKQPDAADNLTGDIAISGTAPTETTGAHTDIALTGVFNAHIALIASERTAIWQRFAVSITCNAVLVAFMGSRSNYVIGATSILGILLSALSEWMLEQGYTLFARQLDVARRFKWQTSQEINPFPFLNVYHSRDSKRSGRKFDPIRWSARLILLSFALFFVATFVAAVWFPRYLEKAQP